MELIKTILEAACLCTTAKTVDVATTDTSLRFTSLLTKIAETVKREQNKRERVTLKYSKQTTISLLLIIRVKLNKITEANLAKKYTQQMTNVSLVGITRQLQIGRFHDKNKETGNCVTKTVNIC